MLWAGQFLIVVGIAIMKEANLSWQAAVVSSTNSRELLSSKNFSFCKGT